MSRANSCWNASVLWIALVGCSQNGSGSTTASNEHASETTPSVTAAEAGTIGDEAHARQFATKHVNEYIASQTFTDDAGEPITPPNVELDTWRQVEQNGDRWTLKRGPPGNWYYHASFDADGSNPEYEVVYFAE
jgi:hypothetical protein